MFRKGILSAQGGRRNKGATWNISAASYDGVSYGLGASAWRDLDFKPDGTKMYANNTSTIFQYTLGTAWNLSTASYDSVSTALTGTVSVSRAMFGNSGTKLYMVDKRAAGSAYAVVRQWSASTAYDVSSLSDDSVSLDIYSEETGPTGLTFSANGVHLYVIGAEGHVFQYDLSTAWDLSTASYASKSYNFQVDNTDPSSGVIISPNGKVIVDCTRLTNGIVHQFNLSTAYNASTASDSSYSFQTDTQDANVQGIVIRPDGKKLYFIGVGTNTVYQYSL